MTAAGGLAVLSTISARRAAARGAAGTVAREPAGRCDLCDAVLGAEHQHLVDVGQRQLRCACRACWLLFDRGGARQALRAVPEQVSAVPDVPAAVWDELGLPVGTAFLLPRPDGGAVAVLPGPAGATEAEPSASGWAALLAAAPSLQALQADVQGVLVHRPRDGAPTGSPTEAFVVPVDRCYALAGLLRSTWRGLDGGPEARAALEGFLADLRRRAGRS